MLFKLFSYLNLDCNGLIACVMKNEITFDISKIHNLILSYSIMKEFFRIDSFFHHLIIYINNYDH